MNISQAGCPHLCIKSLVLDLPQEVPLSLWNILLLNKIPLLTRALEPRQRVSANDVILWKPRAIWPHGISLTSVKPADYREPHGWSVKTVNSKVHWASLVVSTPCVLVTSHCLVKQVLSDGTEWLDIFIWSLLDSVLESLPFFGFSLVCLLK